MKRVLIAALALVALAAGAHAQTQAPPPQPQPTNHGTEALIVLNAKGARLSGDTLVLEGPQPTAIVFADRPVRAAGQIPTEKVIELWSGGDFGKSPPNATVSVFHKDGSTITDAVLVLDRPRLADGRLTFTITRLHGDLGDADGPAAVFIDTIWFGFGPDGVHYLGTSKTGNTAGFSPNVGDRDTAFTGWPYPAPNGPDSRQAATRPNYGLSAPPDLRNPTGTQAPLLNFVLEPSRSNLAACAKFDASLTGQFAIAPAGQGAAIRSATGMNDYLMLIEAGVYKSNIMLDGSMLLVVADLSRQPATLVITERSRGCRWSASAK